MRWYHEGVAEEVSVEKAQDPQGAEDFSFKWFARHGFYRAVNAYLLEMAGLHPGQRVVELACGTGAVTRMILEKLRGARESAVIAIDMSASALREAMQNLADAKDAAIQFIQGRAEELSRLVREKADAVIFCNGIHYIQDKASLLHEVVASLKPGGRFAFNTSFFQGAHAPETDAFYRRWMFKALRLLKERYGLLPRPEKVEARRQLTPEQYARLLEAYGLKVVHQEVRTALVNLQGWLDISRFEDFVQGALPGVPLEKASAVLQEAVRQTFQEMGLTAVPRNWLMVVAERPA
ncbi:Ubiquinone/menaquinone biosynthesis C-methyltransferase UbiE [bacterium HR23]|nr:Ubiquinone/menaquinone biosynthesis C-methyltransferase UbiE [bacterium HR23]